MSQSREYVSKKDLETSNKSLQLFLIFFVVGMLLTNLPAAYVVYEQIAFSITLTILLILAASTLQSSKKLSVIGAVLGISTVASHWLRYYMPTKELAVFEILIGILFFSMFLQTILRHVFDKRRVDKYKIEGAVIAFLTVALIMGNLYACIELISPGSFQFGSGAAPGDLNLERKDLIYFSFTTLTTLGLGDILPINPIAKSLMTIEACIGVLFPNILIARLVSLEIVHSQAAEK